MFEGTVMFVEKIRITGTSTKNNKPYDFTNVALSDGFKTVELGLDNGVLDSQVLEQVKKGEKVKVTLDYKRDRLIVVDIKKVA